MRLRIALAVGVAAWFCAAGAAAAPRVFVRGFRGPQAGEIRGAVASAIRGAVQVVGSARGADAIVDGSVGKKGLSWVLSITVRDGGGKALGGRSYPMPAPRVDRSTSEKLRRDIPSLAARASKGGGAAAAKAEPAPAATRAPPPRKVAKAKTRARPRRASGRSAADEADAADDDDDRPRRESAAQRRARLKREKAERAAQARRDKAEQARARSRDRGEPPVRGVVRQTEDDEATDVVGPRGKRADAKAAKARRAQEARERKAHLLAEANARLARAQAEAKRAREEELQRREEAAAARRAEVRRHRQAREDARRAQDAEDAERRAEAQRSRARRADDEDDDRRSRRRGSARDDARDDDERETGRRVARRDELDEDYEARQRSSGGGAAGSSRRPAPDPGERTVRKAAERPRPPGRGPASLAAGVVLSTRHFELSPKGSKLPIYDASFFPAVSVEGELYPLALAGVRAGKDLGLTLRYDRVVGLTSQETDSDATSPTYGQTFNFNNQSQRVEGGLVYRLHTGAAGLAPVVRPMVAVGYQTFSVGAQSSMPTTAYTYVALGLGFFVPIGHPNFGAISTVRYHIIVGLGQVSGFGSAWTAWGVDLSVGLRLFVIRSLEISATYNYERAEMTFQGLGPLASERGIAPPPAAGSDVYQGCRITLGYHF